MKYHKLTAAALLCLFLFSCSTTQKDYAIQASSTMAQANYLRIQYDDVSAAVNKNISLFTPQEQKELVKIDGTFQMILTRLDNALNLSVPTMTIADANYLYMLTKTTYSEARKVVENHINEFTPADKMRLEMFDQDWDTLSKQIESLLHDPTNKDISASLMLMGTLAGNALKIILPLVL